MRYVQNDKSREGGEGVGSPKLALPGSRLVKSLLGAGPCFLMGFIGVAPPFHPVLAKGGVSRAPGLPTPRGFGRVGSDNLRMHQKVSVDA